MSKEQELALGFAASLAGSLTDEHARAAELVLMDERRGHYLANMPAPSPTETPGEVASPPVLRSIAHDGDCVPRSMLVALRQSAEDADVAELRATVVTTMAASPQRYLRLVLEGAEGNLELGTGSLASGLEWGMRRFSHHLACMSKPGCFFQDPDILCLADIFEVPVAVAVASRSARSSTL